MPRQARKKSEAGIYHIMLRGINQQQIFEDDNDSDKFVQVLKDCKEISGFKLFAYCLMGNHIHLLIKPENEPLEQIFRRIGSRYVYWYNIKYQRVGHLFQDRYKSEPVDTDEYFFTVIRYIHQNPVKAGLCKQNKDWKYSSYNEYINKPYLIDSDFVFEMISKEDFIKFNEETVNDICLDVNTSSTIRLTDEQAKAIILKYSKCDSASKFQDLPSTDKKKLLLLFYENGVSIRQMSRLTGTSKGFVERALKF